MLAPRSLSEEQLAWNARWGAPFGYPGAASVLQDSRIDPVQARRLAGPFAFQSNNSTRTIEYPWVFEQLSPSPSVVIDVGGGLCGLQFVLAKLGHSVFCVDPGLADDGRGYGWGSAPVTHADLNAAFHTSVEAFACLLEDTGFEPETIDMITCVSTLEHIPQEGANSLLRHAATLLRPGGRFVATIDLFLNLAPFTRRGENEWGTNIDVAALLAVAPELRLAVGDPAELNGFPAFDPERIQSRLEHYFVGMYPCMAQCVVLEKAAAEVAH